MGYQAIIVAAILTKIKFHNDLFKPNELATSMNADRKTNFLTIFSTLIMGLHR